MSQPGGSWLPDPNDLSRLRYFDGKAWTDAYAAVGGPLPSVERFHKPAGMSRGAKVAITLSGIVLTLFAACSIGASHEPKSTHTKSKSEATAAAAKPHEEVAPAGSTVRDGKFEFEVLGVDRSPTKSGYFAKPAKGEYFTVRLRVTNVGDDARSFSASSQHLIVNGNKYDATSSIEDDNWMTDINPGLGIEANVSFDIPKGSRPSAIDCHDSSFSGGALLGV